MFATAGDEPVYRITLHDAEGGAVRQVCRDAAALPLTDRERGRTAAEGFESLAEVLAATSPPEAVAPIGRLLLSVDGGLWVQRDRPQPGDPHAFLGSPGALYDVFDDAGRYLGELRAPERARLQAVVGDTVWALEFGELDEPSVVAYRLELN